MSTTVRERLYARLVLDPATGCLLWTGATVRGYGHIRIGSRADGTRRKAYVHRLAWELENGPIPAGLTIDHVYDRGCRHRNCANVAHLEPVTQRENNLRGVTNMGAVNARKTHCIRGHEFTDANTSFEAGGRRRCIACHNTWRERRDARAAA